MINFSEAPEKFAFLKVAALENIILNQATFFETDFNDCLSFIADKFDEGMQHLLKEKYFY